MRPVHVLGASAALAPLVAALAPLGMAPLIVVTALAALAMRICRARNRPWRPLAPIVLFILLATLGLLSALWAIEPLAALRKVMQLSGLLACGVVVLDAAVALGADDRQRVGRWLAYGLVAALAVLTVERFAGFPIRYLQHQTLLDPTALMIPYKRAMSALAMLVWPAALALWRVRRLYAVLIVTATFGVLLVFSSDSAQAGLIIAAVACAAGWAWPRAAAGTLAAVLVAYIALAPMLHAGILDPKTMGLKVVDGELTAPILPRSGYHRLLIWRFTAARIAERPVLGWGLESSRYLPGGRTLMDTAEQAMPLHPHSATMQIWVELGLGGALLLAILVGWILGRIRGAAWPRPDKAAALALFASSAVTASLSYGIWQGWWVATLLLAAACAAAIIVPLRQDPEPTAG
jgi:O-antigen ligase